MSAAEVEVSLQRIAVGEARVWRWPLLRRRPTLPGLDRSFNWTTDRPRRWPTRPWLLSAAAIVPLVAVGAAGLLADRTGRSTTDPPPAFQAGYAEWEYTYDGPVGRRHAIVRYDAVTEQALLWVTSDFDRGRTATTTT